MTNVDKVIDDYVDKIKHDENADWEGGSGTLKEKVSEIIPENHYAPIADSVTENEFEKLEELAKIEGDNILEDEGKGKH